jgi:hypothetical protein
LISINFETVRLAEAFKPAVADILSSASTFGEADIDMEEPKLPELL